MTHRAAERTRIPTARGIAIVLSCWLAVTPALFGQSSMLPTTFRDDAVWSGQITITQDVSIRGATVHVEPGTIIRFAGGARVSAGPTLQLARAFPGSAPGGRVSRLILAGTPDRPVVVETPPGHGPGSITSGPLARCALIGRHVVFRRLGSAISAREARPAVLLVLSSPDADVWLTDCRFEHCGPLRAEFFGTGGSFHVERCTFTDTLGPATLRLTGRGAGLKVARGNVADAAFQIESPQVLLRDNVLVGEDAAVSAPSADTAGVAIVGNYVHCTTRQDVGHYALRCEPPDAVVSGNVLIGGTYVLQSAPRTVTGNVLVGAAALEPDFARLPNVDSSRLGPTTSPTHALIGNLAPDAVITNNLFLGPARAALTTSGREARPRIENNLFDGWSLAHRAVHFNLLIRSVDLRPIHAVLKRNVITRYIHPPVTNGARADDAGPSPLAEVGDNLFAEVPDPPYETLPDVPGLAPGDRKVDRFSQLRFTSPAATQAAGSLSRRLLTREMTVAEARRAWLTAYRPQSDSPLNTHPAGPLGPRSEAP